jgi:tripartite-type tricarboxylate transporter receptor subunit TctC
VLNYAKANPGSLNLGHSSPIYECWAMAMYDHGYVFNIIPFPTGAAASAAIAGGHVDVGIVGLAGAKPLHEGGQLRILYIGDDLSPVPPAQLYSDFPYLSNILRGISVATASITAPKGTPVEVIKFLEDAFYRMWNDPNFQTMAINLGLDPTWYNHEAITAKMAEADRIVSDLTTRHRERIERQAQ